jgi:hypothetical protein
MSTPEELLKMLERFPFMCLARYSGQEYLGIIQNYDTSIVSMYVYSRLQEDDKVPFLEMGDQWWWESNRQLPINIVLGAKFRRFQYSLHTFSIKEFDVVAGHAVTLQSVITKRIKRRQIQLIRKIDAP